MSKRIKMICWNNDRKYNQIFYYDGTKLLNMRLEKTDWKTLQAFKNFQMYDVKLNEVLMAKGVDYRGLKAVAERVWDEQVIRTQVTLF